MISLIIAMSTKKVSHWSNKSERVFLGYFKASRFKPFRFCVLSPLPWKVSYFLSRDSSFHFVWKTKLAFTLWHPWGAFYSSEFFFPKVCLSYLIKKTCTGLTKPNRPLRNWKEKEKYRKPKLLCLLPVVKCQFLFCLFCRFFRVHLQPGRGQNGGRFTTADVSPAKLVFSRPNLIYASKYFSISSIIPIFIIYKWKECRAGVPKNLARWINMQTINRYFCAGKLVYVFVFCFWTFRFFFRCLGVAGGNLLVLILLLIFLLRFLSSLITNWITLFSNSGLKLFTFITWAGCLILLQSVLQVFKALNLRL